MVEYSVLFWILLIVDVLLCIFIIAFNLILLLTILGSRAARARTRNLRLVSICVADLMVGAFTHPLYINTYRTATLYHSCELHVLLQLLGDYTQDFVCFWTLLTLGVVYMYTLVGLRCGWRTVVGVDGTTTLAARPSRFVRVCRMSKKALEVTWPWVAALVVPVPILLYTVDEDTQDIFWDDSFCPLHMSFPARIAVWVMVFYLPMGLLIVLCVAIIVAIYYDVMSTNRYARPAESLVECDVLCNGTSITAGSALVAKPTSKESAVKTDSSRPADPSSNDFPASADWLNTAGYSTTGSDTVNNHVRDPDGGDVDPEVIVLGSDIARPGDRPLSTHDPEGDLDLERPAHMLLPVVVTLVCELPLLIGWWFYSSMDLYTVIIADITLHRLYLLRAAILPLSWFAIPDLRQAFFHIRTKVMGGGLFSRLFGSTGQRSEQGDFSVAYCTLQETRDGPAGPDSSHSVADGTRQPRPNDAAGGL